jgi:hypothetical protein
VWCEGEKTIRNKNLAASAATNDTMSSNGRDEVAPDTLCRSSPDAVQLANGSFPVVRWI